MPPLWFKGHVPNPRLWRYVVVWGLSLALFAVTLAASENWWIAAVVGVVSLGAVGDVLFSLRVPDDPPRRPG